MLGVLASAAAFGLSPMQAHAGTFSISPLRADLSSRSQTGALTLRNQEDSPVVVQAEVLLWEQPDGQDKLSPNAGSSASTTSTRWRTPTGWV
jgi:fimbrial chaperone protein